MYEVPMRLVLHTLFGPISGFVVSDGHPPASSNSCKGDTDARANQAQNTQIYALRGPGLGMVSNG